MPQLMPLQWIVSSFFFFFFFLMIILIYGDLFYMNSEFEQKFLSFNNVMWFW